MEATTTEVQALLDMQALKLQLAQAIKTFNELPQRQTILTLRQKRQEIEKKSAQVEAALKQANGEVSRLADEDARLAQKQAEAQAAIEEAGNDFRAVESRSKEMNALAKQRGALDAKVSAAGAALEKVKAVSAQIEAALAALDQKESVEVASFKEQGTALQQEIAQLKAEYADLEAQVSAALLTEFEKVARNCGGVAIGRLAQGRCGCCRTPIDDAHLSALVMQAPLATCPTCKRLLVI